MIYKNAKLKKNISSKIQKHKNAKYRKFKKTKIQNYKHTKIQKHAEMQQSEKGQDTKMIVTGLCILSY